MSEALIESRQFISWWRDAVSDAITSSAYTGERAIHSSDFSAFTKRSHYPSLLRFSGPTYLCDHPSALRRLPQWNLFSSRWSAMEFRCCQPPCARFIACEDPHSKCIKCLGFSHARDAVYGTSKCKICDDFRLITLRLRIVRGNPPFFPGAHRAPPRLLVRSRPLVRPRPLVKPWPGVRMPSSRRFSPSLSRARACERIRRSNSCMIFCFLARGHMIPFFRARWYSAHSSLRLRGFRACFSRCAPA